MDAAADASDGSPSNVALVLKLHLDELVETNLIGSAKCPPSLLRENRKHLRTTINTLAEKEKKF